MVFTMDKKEKEKRAREEIPNPTREEAEGGGREELKGVTGERRALQQ